MELDFGGVVKEYAADAAAVVARRAGIRHGLVNLGGDICIVGPQANGEPWPIGIVHPERTDSAIAMLSLNRGALTTSGRYERFVEIEGRRYSHLIDPRNGWPVEGLLSVTVVAEQTIVAGSIASIAALQEPTDGPGLARAVRCSVPGGRSATLLPRSSPRRIARGNRQARIRAGPTTTSTSRRPVTRTFGGLGRDRWSAGMGRNMASVPVAADAPGFRHLMSFPGRHVRRSRVWAAEGALQCSQRGGRIILLPAHIRNACSAHQDEHAPRPFGRREARAMKQGDSEMIIRSTCRTEATNFAIATTVLSQGGDPRRRSTLGT